MEKEKLIKLVLELREKGKEGPYWDFKQEWHEDTGELIKDIICFTNTVHDKDCYLIFGVSNDLKIVGMTKTRRKQADIIDTINNLSFATVHIPQISVETIDIYGKEIDVLTIYNTDKTPVYLKTNYGKMLSGCIYTRTEDRNTPDNSNADEEQIEYLWKKRFGLTKPALQFIIEHLANKHEWTQTENEYYNIYHPEYVLRIQDEIEDRYKEEFYGYVQENEKMSFEWLDVVANNTVLKKHYIAILDSGRLAIPEPEWGHIYKDNDYRQAYPYKYYVENSDTFKILEFLYDPSCGEEFDALSRHMDVVLLYHSKEERALFENYVTARTQEIDLFIEANKSEISISTGSELKSETYSKLILTGTCLNQMLSEFRKVHQ